MFTTDFVQEVFAFEEENRTTLVIDCNYFMSASQISILFSLDYY